MLLSKKKKHSDHRYNTIVIDKDGFEKVNESFNRLKDNVLYFNADNNMNVIAITSSTANEGKTTVITNLAVSLASNGKKVVIVDCDFRKPKVHRTFNLENNFGIHDYIVGAMKLNEIVMPTEYNVGVICRGKKIENTSAIFTSEKFKEMIEQLKESYDYVFLDCPPVLEISDYIHISSIADGMIFCVAYGRTKKVQVRDSITLLKQRQTKILGIVYTMVDEKMLRAKSGYYYSNLYLENKNNID